MASTEPGHCCSVDRPNTPESCVSLHHTVEYVSIAPLTCCHCAVTALSPSPLSRRASPARNNRRRPPPYHRRHRPDCASIDGRRSCTPATPSHDGMSPTSDATVSSRCLDALHTFYVRHSPHFGMERTTLRHDYGMCLVLCGARGRGRPVTIVVTARVTHFA